MGRRVWLGVLFLLALGLTQVQAQDFEWIRAAYWDARYPTGWADEASSVAVRDGLQAAGYEILDADQLKTWMSARIADKKYSVVVFCRDIGPDTVCESMSATCTLRKYLDAGGKIVHYADIPLYNQGHADGTSTNWAEAGANNILGIGNVSIWDSNTQVQITTLGAKWGLTQTWASVRPYAASDLDVLATDATGNAAAWVKHFVKGDTFRGFVRLWDRGGHPPVEDIIRVAEYVGFKASNPSPVNGAVGVTSPLLTWDASSLAVFHDVYVGTSPELTAADSVGPRQNYNLHWHMTAWEPGVQYFWRVDEVEGDGTVRTGDVWSFTAAPLTAFAPLPRNGDKWIDPNVTLSWSAGQNAANHDVYFSTDEAAVANRDAGALAASGQGALTYSPGTLQPETVYYWAIDEHTMTDQHPGAVWSFTTTGPGVGGGVKAEYFNGMTPTGVPALTRIDPEINFNWGDPGNPGPGLGDDQFSARWTADLEIAAADTYTFITRTDDGSRLWLNGELIVDQWVDQGPTDAPSKPIYLEPGVYPLQMEYYENGGGAAAQLFWETPQVARAIIPAGPLQPPVRARVAYPLNGDVNVPQDLTLVWTAGEQAVQHQVYFGTDKEAVAAATPTTAGIYQGQQALDQTTFDPGTLEWNTVWYWRVDEVNDANPDSPWIGSVWSFTTADFLVVDDFETYNDVEGEGTRIYETWIDGYADASSGSIVGHLDPPFAEQTIVHGGKQSMPLAYDNSVSPYFSEAYRDFASTQDWTAHGVDSLSLWVRGAQALIAPVVETAGKMTVTGEGSDIWNNSDQFTYVYKTLNGDGALVARVTSVGTGSNAWAKGGVMIRASLDADSSHATMAMTGDPAGAGNGASFQYRLDVAGGSANSDSTTAVAVPYWVKIERSGGTLTASYAPDGQNWTVVGTPQYITMDGPAYVGVAVTSHAAGEYRTFEFDNITATGAAGSWATKEIGLTRNTPQNLYVTVEDSTGNSATAVDPNVVNAMTWTEVKFPLTQFAGVSLSKVKTLYLGVGDRDNPTPDGTGMVYLDDIRVTKP
jgi:hypothetical protein